MERIHYGHKSLKKQKKPHCFPFPQDNSLVFNMQVGEPTLFTADEEEVLYFKWGS